MHTVKSHRRSAKRHYKRNRAQRKWKVAQRQKADTERWIISTVEGKQTNVATLLSRLVTATEPSTTKRVQQHQATDTNKKDSAKAKKRNDKTKKTHVITKPDLTEELRVDVDRTKLNGDVQMKASVDSGVSCRSSSSSHESISEPSEVKEERESGVSFATRFAQNVMEFVSHAQKKIEEQTTKPLTSTTEFIPKPTIAKPLVKEAPRRRRERVCKLLPSDVAFCAYMMETYKEDYEAMAKDSKNVFMDDAKALARKIRVFRESPQYEEYLQEKQVAAK